MKLRSLVAALFLTVAASGFAWEYVPFTSMDQLLKQSPVVVLATGYRVSVLEDGLEEWHCVFKHVLKGEAPVNKKVVVLVQGGFVPKFTNLEKEACLLFLSEQQGKSWQYMSASNSGAVLPAIVPKDLAVLGKMEIKEAIRFLVASYLKDKKSDIERFEQEVMKDAAQHPPAN
jgi:hypothetical protein